MTVQNEIMVLSPPSFETLLHLAYDRLRPLLNRWCLRDVRLHTEQDTDDVMQTVCVKLMQNSVTGYFLRENTAYTTERNATSFAAWVTLLAHNVERDFARAAARKAARERGMEPEEEAFFLDASTLPDESREYTEELLNAAFEVVLNADMQVYKVLTWVANSLYMLHTAAKAKDAKTALVATFSDMTLYQMRDLLFQASAQITWLRVSPAQKQRIACKLAEPYDAERCYGQVKYADFFMKKGGKATVCDWVSRMNERIKRVMMNDTSNS